jgi:hypothetical protein
LTRNELIRVPDVSRSTLSSILRGRIEEIAGWALYYQNNAPEAVIRLRRAVSVMPDKSAWWRSSMWKLGAALQADGKEAEALDSYIKSYKVDKPDVTKYAIVETLYRKLKGSADGLEAQIGANPLPVVAIQKTESTDPKTGVSPTPDPAVIAKVEDIVAKSDPPAVKIDSESRQEPKPDAAQTPAVLATPTPPPEPTSHLCF